MRSNRFSRFAQADLDRHLVVEGFQEIEQPVGGKAVEKPVHQMGRFRLPDAEQSSDFVLVQRE
jgi:hypothetical protein